MWLITTFVLASLLPLGLVTWRLLDRRAEAHAWTELTAKETEPPTHYDPQLIQHLPEPARRYFDFMIAPGAPLQRIVELEMTGEIGLGNHEAPAYRPMRARQILAPPHGLLWRVEAGAISGSDCALWNRSWTRFWLFNVLPVVRVSGVDHHRSAFGRVVAEAAFWAPASLLPGPQVTWEAVDTSRARAIVRLGKLEQAVEISVAESGAPTAVLIQRWSNANAAGQFREQPFGGTPSRFRRFDGYQFPTHIEGGNFFGTPEYFPFFKADLTDVRFPGPASPPLTSSR